MNVVMITGDSQLLIEGSSARERLALQQSAVERLDVVYWGRGALLKALKVRGSYDVVTVQDPLWRGLVGLFLAHTLGSALNVQVHMDLDSLPFIKRAIAQFVLRRADTVRVVSEKTKEHILRFGIKAKITVLPVFVDLGKFHFVVRKPHEGKNILWIGRFEQEKNPLAAIEVLRGVLVTVPEARLLMLGTGSMKEELARAAVNMPVYEILSGWQDPRIFLDTADVVLCTSQYESWGASIVEALAAGVPVVAPDVGVAKEAGAIVVQREKLVDAVVDVLQKGGTGRLALPLLPKAQWAVQWRQSLI